MSLLSYLKYKLFGSLPLAKHNILSKNLPCLIKSLLIKKKHLLKEFFVTRKSHRISLLHGLNHGKDNQ